MTTRLLLLRCKKLLYCATHPWCWQPLRHGVAPSMDQATMLRALDFDLLLDAGANKGQFTLMTTHVHPTVPVHAYEPHPGEAKTFRVIHRRNPKVVLHELALGESEGSADLIISKRTDSSSLLPAAKTLSELFSGTEPSGETCAVRVSQLDAFALHWQSARKALLKIDVQGYELQVLQGARQALKHCAYVYVESSDIVLYEGQALFDEVKGFLEGEGFQLKSRSHEDIIDGRLIQADYLFERSLHD
jgi:FkbM family methyltransferase